MSANIQKGRVTHGVYGWLRTGKINPSVRGFKRIRRYLREIEQALIADIGGPEKMTAAQEVLIKSTIQAYGVLLLAGAYTQRYSILDPAKARRGVLELQPLLGRSYIAFLNTIRCNLVALGLDQRKADEPLDVIAYVQEKYGQKGRDQGPDGLKNGQGSREGHGEEGADE